MALRIGKMSIIKFPCEAKELAPVEVFECLAGNLKEVANMCLQNKEIVLYDDFLAAYGHVFHAVNHMREKLGIPRI
jgi:hypothetical protein